MATGDKKINLYLKKFLTQQQFKDNFLDYLHDHPLDNTAIQYPDSGVFDGGILSGASSDTFRISIPTVGTNGQGRILSLDPNYSLTRFENNQNQSYEVGLRFAEIASGTEINVRTGEVEYSFTEDAIGDIGLPSQVVDNGTSVTLNIDPIFETNVDHGGRSVLVYLKSAVAEADAFYVGVSNWNGTNNEVTTTHIFGQTAGSVSTVASDYVVFCYGATVKRLSSLSQDPNTIFLGEVTGAGSGNVPNTFDQSQINILFAPGDLNAVSDQSKSFLTGGGLITWDLASETLDWQDALDIILPNKPHNFSLAATTITQMADGDILYFQAALPGGTKPVIKAPADSMPDVANSYPVAIRRGNNIFFRDGALELKGSISDGSTGGRINDITQDLLTFMGATDESDSDPFYASVPNFTPSTIAQGDSLTLATDKINAALSAFLTNQPQEEEFVVGAGGETDFTVSTFTFSTDNTLRDIEVFVDGRRHRQDETGANLKDFVKATTTRISFQNPVNEGSIVTIWKQGFTNGGIFAPSTGKLWSDAVDAAPIPNADSVHDLGSSVRRFRESHTEIANVNKVVLKNGLGDVSQTKKLRSTTSTGVIGQPVAKTSLGELVLADSDNANQKRFVGIALESWAAGESPNVLLSGMNIKGILNGLGFAPGDEIFIGETAGTYTNNPGAFTGSDDDIIKVGIADCEESVASSTATDLIMTSTVESRS